MKTTIVCFLLLASATAFAQLQHYDSSYTLISSSSLDILNPVFYKGTDPMPYSGSGNVQLMLYEKGDSNIRNVAVRRMSFATLEPETMLTNDTLFNTNAALAHTKGSATIGYALAVFETHSQGSVRLRYSYYDGNSWTTALHIPTDTSQCIAPSATNLGQSNSSGFLLTYLKQGNVYVRRFDAGSWGREFRISVPDTSRHYNSPRIMSADYFSYYGRAHVAFNYDSAGIKRILYADINSLSFDSCVVNSYTYFSQTGNMKATGFSRNFNLSPVLNIDYQTGGNWKFYSAQVTPSLTYFYPQENFSGDNYSGSGTALAIITEQLSQYIAGSWLNQTADTVWACCKHFGYEANKYRIDQQVLNRVISISPLIRDPITWKCRVKIVWNDIENGRYVLKASDGLFELGSINSENGIANEFELYQNYPNPFNPSTKISYKLQMSGFVSLKIHDIAGREINSLVNARQNAGSYEIIFPSDNLQSGVYFYSMYIDGVAVASRKMVVLK